MVFSCPPTGADVGKSAIIANIGVWVLIVVNTLIIFSTELSSHGGNIKLFAAFYNRGFAICNRCGAVMDRREDPRGGCDIYACPSCGWEIDEMEYEYESGDPMELVQDERGDDYLVFRNDMPPAGCRACGGPYPYCKPSCRMFDD